MIAIAIVNKELWSQQNQLSKHKRYFTELLHDNTLALGALLLPAFFAGWNSGRIASYSQRFTQFGKFVALAVMSHIKQM